MSVPNGKIGKCKLSDILYFPGLSHNLLSVSKAESNGKSFEFGQSHCNIIDNKFSVIATAAKCGSLYYLNCGGSNLSVKENHTAMNVQVLTEQVRAYGIEDMDILGQEI